MSHNATFRAVVMAIPLLAIPAQAGQSSTSTLLDVVKRGDQNALQTLLATRSKDDLSGLEGTEALIESALRNDKATVDLLLRAGGDAKSANEFGATPLYAAASVSDPTLTAKLLAAGGDPNAALLSGETPLMEAARRGNVETAKALLAGGANPDAREGNAGQTALMWAISEQHRPVVEALISGGADIQISSKRGSTALTFAAQQPDVTYTRVLLAAGAKPNDTMGKTGLTPLLIASAMGHTDVALLLLDKQANPNAVDALGFTPLHHAARDKRGLKIVKALLAHGANPNARLKQEKPVTRTTTDIQLRGATPLALAAEINNFEAVKALVEGGGDPLIPTDTKTTPLMLAAGAGTDVVRPRGAKERTTAIQTVKYLMEHGAVVDDSGQFGWTPLHAAAYQGLNDVIEYLVARGADLDAKDSYGQTPLSIANSILTRDIGASTLQIPRIYRRQTAELLLRLGATPIEKSGVVVVFQRTGD